MLTASVHFRGVVTACALVFGLNSAASAATLQITSFDRSDLTGARAALAAFQNGTDGSVGAGERMRETRQETFAGLAAWNGVTGAADPATAVGRFTSLGGKGSGSSAIAGGEHLQVRDASHWRWGRASTSGSDKAWLDSNDTLGMRWEVGGPPSFNALAFLLTDVADVGAKFSLKVGDTLFSEVLGASGRLANGSIQLVRILLPQSVSGITVELANNRLNDGFGIDGATVGRVAPVPVPPAALLLVSGAAALFGLRRRQAKRSA